MPLIIIRIFVFLLPLHALIITFLKCRVWIDTDIIRFWKEIILIILFLTTVLIVFKKNKFNLEKIYKNNYILWLTTVFWFSTLFYVFFPRFEITTEAILGIKYDLFFFFALLIWFYFKFIQNNINKILKTVFISAWIILVLFLPWFLFWDIWLMSKIFWYSSEVSTYISNACIAFAQNVDWHHRFQWTFWWPIRFSVFITVFYLIYLWFISQKNFVNKKLKYLTYILPSIFVFSWVFFSYSKTSILGLVFWLMVFIYLVRKIRFNKEIKKKHIIISGGVMWWLLTLLLIVKWDLLIHAWAIFSRLESLEKSFHMLKVNLLWYWIWIAWPATQIHWIEYRFLPENWYVQILLEQWIFWFAIFSSLLYVIWKYLYKIIKIEKSYLSIWIFTWYISLLFMACFTHSFEESATSYILFMIIGWYIWKNYKKIK